VGLGAKRVRIIVASRIDALYAMTLHGMIREARIRLAGG